MKMVMLSYFERNEIIKGEWAEIFRGGVSKKFFYQGNVSICISFHKFDPDWDNYIEVEKGTAIDNNDKLKAIVTPQLMTPVCSADSAVSDDLSSPQVFSSTLSGSK